ncbi:hypothetical protein [Aquisalimonas sp.]|uniref:hypothetical protein n=1 Tax=Aquisalimonas sp. TaxID=1872621 RepID=UPI0025C23DBD|nr:hypothetical protein [Aquisalimonas sp.]
MQYRTSNPLLQVILLIFGVVFIGAAFFLGALLLAVFLGLGVIVAVILWIRFRLLQGLRWRGPGKSAPPPESHANHRSTVIEGEYEIRSAKASRKQRPPNEHDR